MIGDDVARYSKAVVSGVLWNLANVWAYDYAVMNMKDRYFLLKYEDLCTAPQVQLESVAAFVGKEADAALMKKYENEIKSFLSEKSSLKRYMAQDPLEVAIIEDKMRDGLTLFNYL